LGWGHDGRKISWVKWSYVYKPKELGGSGIKEVQKFNSALLANWKLRLGIETDVLLLEQLNSKYRS